MNNSVNMYLDNWGAAARCLVHVSAPILLFYYFLPSPLWAGGPSKEASLLVVFSGILVFELLRLSIGFKVPGMRWYEENQMSAGAWAGIGITFAFLFFPFAYAAPIIMGMAWVDPIAGMLRRTKWYPYVPLAVHLAIVLTALALLTPFTWNIILAGIVASVLAIAAESYKTRYVDDDFLMIAVPLVGMALILTL